MEKAVVYNIGDPSDETEFNILKKLDQNENEFINIVRNIEDECEKATFIQMCISLTERNNLANLDDDELELINTYKKIMNRRDQWILIGMFKRMVEENICNEYK